LSIGFRVLIKKIVTRNFVARVPLLPDGLVKLRRRDIPLRRFLLPIAAVCANLTNQ